ncbi:hypothetical protein [Peptoniphilus stercorisuis]|uniref:Cell division protein FtsL n=1 Tax=Peptoniphilus stercorisuis TaxID=1436965 RepID=A0ABS4KCH9_9FIRM|nr:hypothetical protein [Peptoniphilus stercorisuis]MBP2025469.1 hypothetical protein [Peptoniphilus stercorisuis]
MDIKFIMVMIFLIVLITIELTLIEILKEIRKLRIELKKYERIEK